jgi:DNA primase
MNSRLDADTIKAAIQPKDYYKSELPTMPQPNRTGWVDGGLCPFHPDRRAGSFKVNIENGAYRCFSCDARGGDVLAFSMQRDGINFQETLEKLAGEWGLR